MTDKQKKQYKHISFDKVAEVYSKKAGNVGATAKALNITRSTLISWRKAFPELAEKMRDVDEALLDFSESKLLQQIDAGNITAIIFHLKTKGRSRGYVEQIDSNVNVNAFEQLMKSLPED